MEIDAGPARCINIACNNDFWKEGETGIYLCNDVSSIPKVDFYEAFGGEAC